MTLFPCNGHIECCILDDIFEPFGDGQIRFRYARALTPQDFAVYADEVKDFRDRPISEVAASAAERRLITSTRVLISHYEVVEVSLPAFSLQLVNDSLCLRNRFIRTPNIERLSFVAIRESGGARLSIDVAEDAFRT